MLTAGWGEYMIYVSPAIVLVGGIFTSLRWLWKAIKNDLIGQLDRIEAQTLRTNGRVTALEVETARINGILIGRDIEHH